MWSPKTEEGPDNQPEVRSLAKRFATGMKRQRRSSQAPEARRDPGFAPSLALQAFIHRRIRRRRGIGLCNSALSNQVRGARLSARSGVAEHGTDGPASRSRSVSGVPRPAECFRERGRQCIDLAAAVAKPLGTLGSDRELPLPVGFHGDPAEAVLDRGAKLRWLLGFGRHGDTPVEARLLSPGYRSFDRADRDGDNRVVGSILLRVKADSACV